MWCHHGQKYGHTQGTPRETNEIRKPDTLVHVPHHEPRLSLLNMTTSAGVIVAFEDFPLSSRSILDFLGRLRVLLGIFSFST